MKPLHFIAICLLLPACILPFEVEPDRVGEEEILVVEGILSNSPEERLIRISYQDGRGTLLYPQVVGQIFREGEFWADLVYADKGLVVPPDLLFEEGLMYHLELLVEDSIRVHSRPQLIPPILTTDSMSFRLDRRIGGTSIQGIPTEEVFIDIYAHVDLADPGEQKEYYFWNVDEAWSFTEISDPFDPLDVIQTCYPTLPMSVHPSTLLSNEQLAAGQASMRIATRLLDNSFLEQHYFNAYLRSFDAANYLYFQEATRIIEGAGGLYEQIPGTLLGNVFNPDNSNERVFGTLAIALIDTVHFPIFKTDLGYSISDPCSAENVQTNPRRCFECKVAFGEESLIKPPYWQ